MIGIFPRFGRDPQNNPGGGAREIRPGLMSRDPDFSWSGIRFGDFITDPGYGDLMTDDPVFDLLDRDQCQKMISAGSGREPRDPWVFARDHAAGG